MKKIAYTIIFLFCLASVSFGANKYVSPTGAATWANCGDPAKSGIAACSVTTAEQNADDDDIVYFRDGTYLSETLTPSNSGTSGHPITFKNYTGETPTFDGEDVVSEAVILSNKSYITIDGFTFQHYNGTEVASVNTGSFAVGQIIQNCKFYSWGLVSPRGGSAIFSSGSDGFQIIDCTIDAASGEGLHGITFSASADGALPIKNTKISGCTLNGYTYGGGVDDAINIHTNGPVTGLEYTPGAGHLIVNNTFNSNGAYWDENCIDVSGAKTVIRGNNIYHWGSSPGITAGDPNAGMTFLRIEENTVHGAGWHQMHMRLGTVVGPTQILKNQLYGKGGGLYFNVSGTYGNTYDVYVFHNTLDATDLNWADRVISFAPASDAYLNNTNTKNNIIYFRSGLPGIILSNETLTGNAYDGNLYYDTGNATSPTVWSYGGTKTLAQVQALGVETNAVESDPLFVAAGSNNYTITTSSPAYNTAVFLTTITSATESTSTPTVDDPNWFYDGWGISGETGDTFYTAGGQSATITSIDYDTGVITLSGAISVVNGEGVTNISLNPDIGYYEVEGQSSPVASVAATDSAGAEEGTDPTVFTISFSPNADGEDYNYAFSGGAVLDTDYNCDDEDGTLSAVSGASTTITCTPVDDSDPEITETITVTLQSGTGYTVGSPNQASATITDNDGAQDQAISGITVDASGSGQVNYDSAGSGSWAR